MGENYKRLYEEAELEWSAYAVTLKQQVDRLVALARRRGIDEEPIRLALSPVPGAVETSE